MEQGFFGTYWLVEMLEQSDSFESWLATVGWEDRSQRPVVVESMTCELAEERRFIDEAWQLARLNHLSIAQVFDIGRSGDRCYLARQHLPGLTLRAISERCRAKGQPLPAWFLMHVASQVCQGLQYARDHDASDGHQWITPDKITVCLFGACKLTGLGRFRGEGEDLCMEHIGRAGCGCDVISVGATLYETLTGIPVFDETRLDSKSSRITLPGVSSSMIPELEFIVTRAMALAGQGFAGPAELAEAIDTALRELGDSHTPREVGLFVSSLFPDLLDCSVILQTESRWWERLNNFIITDDDNRWTEEKLQRPPAEPMAQTVQLGVNRSRQSWIRRLLRIQTAGDRHWITHPGPELELDDDLDSDAAALVTPPPAVVALDTDDAPTEQGPPNDSLPQDPWTRPTTPQREPMSDPFAPQGEKGEESDRMAALWQAASARAGRHKPIEQSPPEQSPPEQKKQDPLPDVWRRTRRITGTVPVVWRRPPLAPEEQKERIASLWEAARETVENVKKEIEAEGSATRDKPKAVTDDPGAYRSHRTDRADVFASFKPAREPNNPFDAKRRRGK